MTTEFHRTWLGPEQIPQQYEDYWMAWQRQFPQATFTTWRAADIPRLTHTRHKIAEATSWAGKSDIARYEILHAHGGVYLDCDMQPYQWFDVQAFGDDLVVCNEDASTDYCTQAFFASPAAHPCLQDLMRAIANTDLSSGPPNETTGPWLFGKALKAHQPRRLQTATFYPYHYTEPKSALLGRDLRHTWGIHVWSGGWLSKAQRLHKAAQHLQRGDLHSVLAMLGPDDGAWLRAAQLATQTRQQILQAASPLFRTALRPVDAVKFGLLKVLFWLLQQNPDRMVWQLAAGDGIRSDPLRPALVNFDPPALLLEAQPDLHQQLVRNYAGNRHARCVPAAVGTGPADTPVLGLAELMALAGARAPEVLVFGAGTGALPLLHSLLDTGHRPQLIHFAMQGLSPEDRARLLAPLQRDYLVLDAGTDTTAHRKDLFLAYARHLYLDHGHATVFAQGIRAVCGA
jgi:hypothetical protein